jgi:hypothetical protein
MPAVYPGSIRTFTTKANTVDVIDASHPNLLQDEVTAIESILGVNPNISTTGSGTYTNVATSWQNVSSRLANLENGITADVHNQYLKLSGGGVVLATSTTTVPLVVRGIASQSANLQEWKNSAGTTVAAISVTGEVLATGATQVLDNLAVVSWVFG